jgi:uncharacterized protein (DUF927 family)
MLALAAPLVRHSNLPESAIFNFVGPSGTGKTTAVLAAASVLGSVDQLGDWNSRDRALHEYAAAGSDLLVVLDDMERFRPDSGRRLNALSSRLHVLTAGTSTGYSYGVDCR